MKGSTLVEISSAVIPYINILCYNVYCFYKNLRWENKAQRGCDELQVTQLISGRVGTSLQPGFPKLRPDRETMEKKKKTTTKESTERDKIPEMIQGQEGVQTHTCYILWC